jgi:phage gp16-like protein
MKMIEPIQVQLIHIAKAQLGLSREEYEDAIAGQTKGKKASSTDLTYFEADGLINYFKTLGFKIQPKRRRIHRPRTQGNVVGLPTCDELNFIALLVKKVPWRAEDGYQRWLTKHMRIRRVATAEQAEKVIEGLKGMLKHTKLPQTGETQCR